MKKNILLHHYPQQLVWKKASQYLIDKLEQVKKEGKNILLFLSGGSVVQLYGQLAEVIKKGGFKSDDLVIAQVDERYIKNQISKIKNTNQKLKINKDINAENIGQTGLWEDCRNKKIPYYLVSQKGTLKSSTEEYNKTVSKLFPRYDFRMAILGMGKDGHTAGLMSGHEKIWNINDYVIGYKLDQKQMFKQRITITPFMLSKLDYALAGMVGEEKKQALESTLNPDNFDELDKYPAAIIQRIKKVDVFTDL